MHLVLIEFSPKAQDEVGFKYCHAVLDITKPLEPQVLEWYRAIYAEKEPKFGADDFTVTPVVDPRDPDGFIYDVQVELQGAWNSPNNLRQDSKTRTHENGLDDHAALDQIQALLRVPKWSDDTLDYIAEVMRASGREIDDVADYEGGKDG